MQDVMIDTAAQAATNYAAYEAVHAATAGPKLKKILDVYEENKAVCNLAAAAIGATMLADPTPAAETVVVVVESGAAALAADPAAIGEAVTAAHELVKSSGEAAISGAEMAVLAAEAAGATVMATVAGLALPVALGGISLTLMGAGAYYAWKQKGWSVTELRDRIKEEWDAVNVEAEELPNVDWEALAQECNSK
jgi:hypothetical protein